MKASDFLEALLDTKKSKSERVAGFDPDDVLAAKGLFDSKPSPYAKIPVPISSDSFRTPDEETLSSKAPDINFSAADAYALGLSNLRSF